MKAKIIRAGGDTVELEGSAEDLAKVLAVFVPQQFHTVPYIAQFCQHEYDINSTAPACKKCGQLMYTLLPLTVTSTRM